MIIDIRDVNDGKLVKNMFSPHAVIGLTSGCYDLFHNLHLTYLLRCRRMCDVLIVGVDSDDAVKKDKGPLRPIIPEHHRVNLVSNLKCVDAAFVMGSLEDWKLAIYTFKPKKLFKNQSFCVDEVVGKEEAEVVIVPDVFQPDSTTDIIEEIKALKSKHETLEKQLEEKRTKFVGDPFPRGAAEREAVERRAGLIV